MLPAATVPEFVSDTTHGLCEERLSDVSVRDVALHTFDTIVAGIDTSADAIEPSVLPSEDEAAATTVFVLLLTADVTPDTCAFVFPFTTATIEEVALASTMSVCPLTVDAIPPVAESMCAFTPEATEDEALFTSVCVASEPVVSEAPVSVRVAAPQTAVATSPVIVPKEVRVRPEYAHTFAGTDRTEDAIEPSVLPSEDEAAVTTLLVLVLTADVIPAVAESVCALTDDVASASWESV